MKKLTKIQKRGFTLLEMVLVVAILVILASLSFINFTDSLQKSRDRQAAEESKFVTHVQSQADHVRRSILSREPRLST
jgi:prepilin-type N-terminal cleavage/methylation domain